MNGEAVVRIVLSMVLIFAAVIIYDVIGKRIDNQLTGVIECDSGFTTSISTRLYLNDGIIGWRNKDSVWNERKMLPGETCYKTWFEEKDTK